VALAKLYNKHTNYVEKKYKIELNGEEEEKQMQFMESFLTFDLLTRMTVKRGPSRIK